VLKLSLVSYRYAGTNRLALRDINLELADGEVVGVVGANEAGKTTLCLVASGLAPRSIGGTLGGSVLIDGHATADLPMHELAALVGICFQNPYTQLSQVADTVFEEVAFGAMNLGLDRLEVIKRVNEALGAIGIAELGDRDPRRLSGGQMQLVAVAGLLAMRPRHLVLDEPVAQLDPEGRALVADALRRLAAAGTGLLITEHDTDLLAQLCTRVVAIDHGAIEAQGAAKDVLANPRLDDWGVEPPARVRLSRALATAGLKADLPL
jgi:energy-coupling factor transporter ATP-binding protein EcfA2